MPGLNLGRTLAGILRAAPVLGLRPVVALRLDVTKVSNPIKRTSSLFFKALVMLSHKEFKTFSAFAWLSLETLAISFTMVSY